MKCNMDCFNCTRPASKCTGGDESKTAVSWRMSTRTSVGKGNPRLSVAGVSRKKSNLIGVHDEDPSLNHE